MEVGTAIADNIFGKVSPAGRLSTTWYKELAKLPPKEDYDIIAHPRTYAYYDDEVLYPFGYGKTYSEVRYLDMTAEIKDYTKIAVTVERVAKEHGLPVTLLCDTNHVLSSDYSEVIVVGAGADAVDYKLISICHRGDIVVSQDYGVAAMALGKGAYAIHQSGKWYTNENIDQMLMERHLNKKARRASGKNHLKGPRKRTAEDDEHFRASFEKMIHMAMDKEN